MGGSLAGSNPIGAPSRDCPAIVGIGQGSPHSRLIKSSASRLGSTHDFAVDVWLSDYRSGVRGKAAAPAARQRSRSRGRTRSSYCDAASRNIAAAGEWSPSSRSSTPRVSQTRGVPAA
jgi:hypothetical protein